MNIDNSQISTALNKHNVISFIENVFQDTFKKLIFFSVIISTKNRKDDILASNIKCNSKELKHITAKLSWKIFISTLRLIGKFGGGIQSILSSNKWTLPIIRRFYYSIQKHSEKNYTFNRENDTAIYLLV